MSMAPGFTAICLLEIPHGNSGVDLYYPIETPDQKFRKLVRVHSAEAELSEQRRKQMLSHGVRILWIRDLDEALFRERVLASPPANHSEISHCLMDACFSAKDLAWQEAFLKASLEILCRCLALTGAPLSSVWKELSWLALQHDQTTHAIRVATTAVLFAMAFDHRDPQFLSDLAVAGFLHDLGKLRLGIPLAYLFSQQIPSELEKAWKTHSDASIELIEKFGSKEDPISERARLWIAQHHERFGGGGFPLGIEGYKVDDISQILAAANLIDELASGRWDGKFRGLKGAFEALEDFDRQQTFPQYFNPQLFKTLLGWSKRVNSTAKSAAA
jgi:HD-GYP domain-containing protein (c-di-GMP phosphodiesterase class II)